MPHNVPTFIPHRMKIFRNYGLLNAFLGSFAFSSLSLAQTSEGLWIWETSTAIHSAHSDRKFFIHQGHFRGKTGKFLFLEQGPPPWRVPSRNGPIVLVYRLDTLVPQSLLLKIHRQVKDRWRSYGVDVSGIQIDFDSPSRKLNKYANWLHQLKSQMFGSESLSITGLCDWLVNSKKKDVNDIFTKTDFIAFMMYQGTKPLRNIAGYVDILQKLSFPFYLGVLNSQISNPIINKAKNAKGFRGVLIFPTGVKK